MSQKGVASAEAELVVVVGVPGHGTPIRLLFAPPEVVRLLVVPLPGPPAALCHREVVGVGPLTGRGPIGVVREAPDVRGRVSIHVVTGGTAVGGGMIPAPDHPLTSHPTGPAGANATSGPAVTVVLAGGGGIGQGRGGVGDGRGIGGVPAVGLHLRITLGVGGQGGVAGAGVGVRDGRLGVGLDVGIRDGGVRPVSGVGGFTPRVINLAVQQAHQPIADLLGTTVLRLRVVQLGHAAGHRRQKTHQTHEPQHCATSMPQTIRGVENCKQPSPRLVRLGRKLTHIPHFSSLRTKPKIFFQKFFASLPCLGQEKSHQNNKAVYQKITILSTPFPSLNTTDELPFYVEKQKTLDLVEGFLGCS